MQYYYYSSSKKLMTMIAIITILLLITTTTTTITAADEDPQGCGPAPVDSGACKGYYLYCVTELITALIDHASNTKTDYSYSLHYPPKMSRPPGGVRGEAICVAGSYDEGCRDCLLGIKEKLTWDCSNSEGGFYSNQQCSIKYHQIP
ncbi:hypothetical protein LINGRAHAP2_LOCUS34027 [Linum grandiflorum]